ncbi:MAG: hypothetical protein ACRDEA_21990 [Microcystaceae cyanobacterium]
MNQVSSIAAGLEPNHRQKLALKILTKQETISNIAEQEGVSRNFLYQQGHSPTELMTGAKHPHWLELLGFERFQRA